MHDVFFSCPYEDAPGAPDLNLAVREVREGAHELSMM